MSTSIEGGCGRNGNVFVFEGLCPTGKPASKICISFNILVNSSSIVH